MTRSHVALLLLSCAHQPPLFGQPQLRGALDVFLVVDNSGSMRPNDPRLSMPSALSAFADRLPVNSQLGILMFDKDVKVLLELTRSATGQFQSAVRDALKNLDYEGARSDLAGAVERAIYELRQQGRSDARRVIVCVTDGVLDLGTESATAAKARWLREDLALEAKMRDVSIFTVTVSQAADYQLVQALARATGGDYYRAPTPEVFPSALAQVTERLTKMVEIAGTRPTNPVSGGSAVDTGIFGRVYVLAAVIVIALAVLGLVLVFARKRPELPSLEGRRTALEAAPPIPSLSVLREQATVVSRTLAAATDLLTQTNSKVDQLQAAVERYALTNYRALQDTDEQCFTLARECVLLLDHLDIMIRRTEEQGGPADSLRDARGRLCSLLETAQIEEIPVNAGDVFDGTVHIATSLVGGGGPEGVVVEVSRKGYAMKARGRGDVLVRAAEVTVSARLAEEKPASGGTT